MAIQIWNQDQVPQLRFAGAQSLAGGIGNAAESIRQGLDKRIEEAKRIKQAGKAADAFYKALPDDRKPMPIEFWDAQSPGDKAQAMAGIIGAQGYQQGIAEAEARAAQTAFTQQRTSEMQQAIERESAFRQRAMALAGPPLEGPMLQGQTRPAMGPVTDEMILQAAIEAGGVSPENLLAYMGKDKTLDAAQFIEDPQTKSRFVTYGKNILPSNNKAAAELEIHTDPGTGLKFRRSGNSWVPLPGQTLTGKPSALEQAQVKAATTRWTTAADLLAVEESKSSPNQKRIDSYNATISNASNTLARIGVKLPASQTKDKGPLPLPTDKSQLENGKLYQTSRGVARWDGEKFIPQ